MERRVCDVVEIDLRRLRDGDERERQRLMDVATGLGFFYLRHHGIDSDFLFDISTRVFALSLEEKMKYDMGTTGNYFGYRPVGGRYADKKGTPDGTEFYNISKDDLVGLSSPRDHPLPITSSCEEMKRFIITSHAVALILLRELAVGLNLPPSVLTSRHDFSRRSGDQIRLTNAPALPQERLLSDEPLLLAEHTDFGSITILFNKQWGLQVLPPGGEGWSFVVPRADCAVVNLGDALVKLVGGRLVSGLHRVVAPPPVLSSSSSPSSPSTEARQSCVYFMRPNSDVRLASLVNEDGEDSSVAPTADEWIARRVALGATANYRGEATYLQARGTEHNNPSPVNSKI